jgi:hypothetical protein
MIGQPLSAYGAEVVEVSSRCVPAAAAMPEERTTENEEQKEQGEGQNDET